MSVWIAQEEVPAAEIAMVKAAPPDPVRVSRYTEALAAAGTNRAAFETTLSDIKKDVGARTSDLVEIAVAYRGGGVRPRSKKSALEMIEKRFVELVRDARKNSIASVSGRPPGSAGEAVAV